LGNHAAASARCGKKETAMAIVFVRLLPSHVPRFFAFRIRRKSETLASLREKMVATR